MTGRHSRTPKAQLKARNNRKSSRLLAEALEPRCLLATFTVTNVNNAGAGSLREAINQSNSNPGADVVEFNIGGSGIRTINLTAPLPTIVDRVTIDATTQPGYSSSPLIELNGENAGVAANGLRINSPSIIRGLAINRFSDAGIRIEQSGTNVGTGSIVQGNFIGTDPTGQIARRNSGSGIVIDSSVGNTIGGNTPTLGNVISGNNASGITLSGTGSNNNVIVGNTIGLNATGTFIIANTFEGIDLANGSFNRIGGIDPGERNVISGNGFRGISIFGSSARSNTIQNNYIGTDSKGQAELGNGFYGIEIFVSDRNLIGGTVEGARNVISGNGDSGIFIISSDLNQIQGNFIGTGADGITNLGNGGTGVDIFGFSAENQVGSTLQGAGNIIAFNGTTFSNNGGVSISSSFAEQNAIRGNSIHSNVGLGIDLGANGLPEPNDPLDPDLGPNLLQNYPDLALSKAGAGRLLIQGGLNSTPSTDFELDIFSSTAADPSGFGEGRNFIGTIKVTTDATGFAFFNDTLTAPFTSAGQFVTATATDPNGNTSEFSAALSIQAGTVVDLAITKSDSPDPATRDNPLQYTLTIVNNGPSAANDVIVTDFLPTGVQFVSVNAGPTGTAAQAGGNVIANYPTIGVGEAVTVTIIVTPTTTGVITNRASVTSSDIDADPTNNNATSTTEVNIPIDLAVTVSADPTPALAASQLTYFFLVYNNGPGQATGTTLNVQFSNDVSIVAISTGQGTFQQIGNSVVASIGTLGADIPSAVRIVVETGLLPTTSVTATVSANEIDTVPGNNTVTLNTPVLPAADLSILAVNPPSVILSGSPLDLEYQIINSGPLDATNVIIDIEFDPSITFVSGAFSNGMGAVVGTPTGARATLPFLAFGDVLRLNISAAVSPSATGVVLTTAIIDSAEEDPDLKNNASAVTTAVNPADVGTTISAPLDVSSGNPFTYTITVTNYSVSTATDPVLNFTLPTNATLVGLPGTTQGVVDTTTQPGLVIVTLGPLVSTATISVSVMPLPGTQVLNASAVVSLEDGQRDPNLSNNTASSSVFVDAANLTVSIQPPAGQIGLGSQATFTYVVTNSGPFAATNVFASVPVPAGTSFISATPIQGVSSINTSSSPLLATIPALAPGAFASFQVTYFTLVAGTLSATASVTGDQIDPDTTDNKASLSFDVLALPGALEFEMTSYTVPDRAGNVTINVKRVNGSSGAIVVNYQTTPGSAVPDLDYVPTAGSLTFLDGESLKSFTVQTLTNAAVTGPRNFGLALTAVGNTQLGPNSTANVTIVDSDADITGPRILDVTMNGTARAVTSVVYHFNEPLNPATAQNPANYTIASGSVLIPIAGVSYTPGSLVVIVTPASALAANRPYQLVVSDNVQDPWANALDGDNNGTPGGNFVATFTRGTNLNYTDGDGDSVNLRLSGPGIIDVIRDTTGEAQSVRVTGANPRRSTISGTVRRRPGGDGRTSLGDIYGIGVFVGGAASRLTTPAFFANQPLPTAAIARSFPSARRLSPRSFPFGR